MRQISHFHSSNAAVHHNNTVNKNKSPKYVIQIYSSIFYFLLKANLEEIYSLDINFVNKSQLQRLYLLLTLFYRLTEL